METKALIRKRALAVRDALTEAERMEKSRMIMEKVMALPIYKEADRVLVYVTYKSEVQTHLLIAQALKEGKKVYCPKVKGETMDFYRVFSEDELEKGYKGIREPGENADRLLKEEELAEGKSMMLMPGSAFDRDGNRIGYGKGYYDKYLDWISNLQRLTTVAVCFECQMQEGIPTEVYDKKADVVVTEVEVVL